MTRKTRCYLVLIVLLAGVSMLAAGNRSARPPSPGRPNQSPPAADPYENRTVLVEAFVVQVDLSVLYGMDVNPLGQAPHSVSVANLLEYLQAGDKASVLVGAKAAALHGSGRNSAKRRETSYYPKTRFIITPDGKKETIDYTPYEDGETLSITPAVISERVVQVSYDFSYSGPREATQHSDAPNDSVSWEWEGTASLNVGRPRIVGATQDAKAAIFFVLTAHILE
jgi:hypothetical protein